jgi:hypothetical protein
MDSRAQGSFEYILLISGAILFVILVIAALRNTIFLPGQTQTNTSTQGLFSYLNNTQCSFQNTTGQTC